MKRSIFRTAVVSATAACLLMSGCALRGAGARARVGDADYIMKFSHVTTENTPKGKAAVKFSELVKEKSNGRIAVEVFSNSELYGDKDEMQALQSNSVQVIAPASAKFTTVAPELQVLDLPFLFDKVEDIPKIAAPETKVGKAIYDNPKLAAKHMKVLGLWDSGMKQLSGNNKMVAPSDLAGHSYRIQPSDVLKSQFVAWDANPTPLAFAEVYSAMQQGLIDGGENTWSNISSQKMHTVQKFITESDHGYIGYILVINKDFYNDLPPDLQGAVTEAATEASTYNRKESIEVNQAAKDTILTAKTTTIDELTPAQRQAFKKTVVPKIWDQYRTIIGPQIIDELKQQNGM